MSISGGVLPYSFSFNSCVPSQFSQVAPGTTDYTYKYSPYYEVCTITVTDSVGATASTTIYSAVGGTGYLYLLYDYLLYRTPAVAETSSWNLAVAASNISCSQLAADFLSSTEFAAKASQMNQAIFVVSLYLALLDRQPDPSSSGLIDALNSGTLTRSQVADIFLQSSEFSQDCINLYGFAGGAGTYSGLTIP